VTALDAMVEGAEYVTVQEVKSCPLR
jgi:hypothetical protein